jgi:two-component system, NtrC family, nitrogen regulation sensor histidine kinase NtrY
MKLNFGIRSSIIILFLGLYLTSLILLNNYFLKQQGRTKQALERINLDDSFAELDYGNDEDSQKARELVNRFRESLAETEMIRNESQIYSSVFLFLLMLISICIFILIFYKITRPMKELQNATASIRNGDFSVKLPETGIKEMKELKQSFNSMSRELDSVQQKLLKAEKDMIWKELSRILAHEIKNPLTPIKLSIQRLEEKFETDPEKFNQIFSDSVEIINQEITNLQNLARSFSTFAKNLNPDLTVFNCRTLIEEIIKPYQNDYDISISGYPDALINFDQTHFYQIITNILQNAIDASYKEKKIRILVERKDKTEIIIEDFGYGIEHQEIEKIFEPYYTKKKKGTGLGLALVKKLIEVNNSWIKVESEKGKGSKFIITTELI